MEIITALLLFSTTLVYNRPQVRGNGRACMKDPSGRRDRRHTNPQVEARGRGGGLGSLADFQT
jgi:hypothetical protein